VFSWCSKQANSLYPWRGRRRRRRRRRRHEDDALGGLEV
jgi:hypothetical protein